MTATSIDKPVRPRHFSQLDGAKTIRTEPFLRTQLAITQCIELSTLGVVVGDAGFGKTFAVDAALTTSPRPVIRTLFSHQATPREVARQLVKATNGEPAGKTRFELTDECVDVMREPHVAVIDEAQHLNRDCTFFLRYLLDHPETAVTLILIGGNGCWERIARDPMLASRVYRRVVFAPVSIQVLEKALPRYHPIYANVSRDLIENIAVKCEIMQMRTLAIFTHTACQICDERGVSEISPDIASRAVALMGRAPNV